MATFYPYGVATDTKERGRIVISRCMNLRAAESGYRGLGCPSWAHVVELYEDGRIARELDRPTRRKRAA